MAYMIKQSVRESTGSPPEKHVFLSYRHFAVAWPRFDKLSILAVVSLPGVKFLFYYNIIESHPPENVYIHFCF